WLKVAALTISVNRGSHCNRREVQARQRAASRNERRFFAGIGIERIPLLAPPQGGECARSQFVHTLIDRRYSITPIPPCTFWLPHPNEESHNRGMTPAIR